MLRVDEGFAGANTKTEQDAGVRRHSMDRYHCPIWVCARSSQQRADGGTSRAPGPEQVNAFFLKLGTGSLDPVELG